MDRATGITIKSIMSASAFRLSILATQGHVRILGSFLLYNVFSIRTCANVYRFVCMA